MMTNLKKADRKAWTVTIALGALLALGLPAQARFDYTNWQPQLGPIHGAEDQLEARMNFDYKIGLIDTCEISMLRRDLDGIAAQEDEFRMDHNGLGPNDVKCLEAKLSRFAGYLDRAESDKTITVASASGR